MDITSKSRNELADSFQANDIPTEHDFKDLIYAPLNQKDHGVTRQTGKGLSIEAAGDQKEALALYQGFVDVGPSWVIGLKSSDKVGLSIRNLKSEVLFIDQDTGRIGVGTNKPEATLDVRGDLRIDGTLSKLDVKENSVALIRAMNLNLGHTSCRGAPGRALVDWKDKDDKKALVLNFEGDWPRAEVQSSLVVTGDLTVVGKLNKLDVKEQNDVWLRAKDLRLGHSTRLNKPDLGRALVDNKNALVLNFGRDWPLVEVQSPLTVKGDLTVDGKLTKLDVTEQLEVRLCVKDLRLGHSERRGEPGRALVDWKEELSTETVLILNYGGLGEKPDWNRVEVRSPFTVKGNLEVEGTLKVRGKSDWKNQECSEKTWDETFWEADGSSAPAYCTDSLGAVHLRGRIIWKGNVSNLPGRNGLLIFCLPYALSPSVEIALAVAATSRYRGAQLRVKPDGEVRFVWHLLHQEHLSSFNIDLLPLEVETWVSLDGVSFFPSTRD